MRSRKPALRDVPERGVGRTGGAGQKLSPLRSTMELPRIARDTAGETIGLNAASLFPRRDRKLEKEGKSDYLRVTQKELIG